MQKKANHIDLGSLLDHTGAVPYVSVHSANFELRVQLAKSTEDAKWVTALNKIVRMLLPKS